MPSAVLEPAASTPHTIKKVTHFWYADTPGKFFKRALCGYLIRVADFSNDPTCDTCRERRQANDDLQVG